MNLGTAETLAFVTRWLPPRCKVLEVGCGTGELALELQNTGHEVFAIDADPATVAGARSRGIEAVVSVWPDRTISEKFDAILFTRSLHHISPLDEAVRLAADVAPMIVIEDFAVSEVSSSFEQWLRSEKPDWEPHDVHSCAAIRAQVAKHFTITHEEQVPYAYRYFDPPEDQRIYNAEKARGELLGRRLVAVA